jgi:hypothetical protein
MNELKFDFCTDYHSPDRIFVSDSEGTAWDVYPDQPMSALQYLRMITEFCTDLVDTDTVKYRISWEGDSNYIRVGRYVLETDEQFNKRQQRLIAASTIKQKRAELENEADLVVQQIPMHLRDLIRNKLENKNG